MAGRVRERLIERMEEKMTSFLTLHSFKQMVTLRVIFAFPFLHF